MVREHLEPSLQDREQMYLDLCEYEAYLRDKYGDGYFDQPEPEPEPVDESELPF